MTTDIETRIVGMNELKLQEKFANCRLTMADVVGDKIHHLYAVNPHPLPLKIVDVISYQDKTTVVGSVDWEFPPITVLMNILNDKPHSSPTVDYTPDHVTYIKETFTGLLTGL